MGAGGVHDLHRTGLWNWKDHLLRPLPFSAGRILRRIRRVRRSGQRQWVLFNFFSKTAGSDEKKLETVYQASQLTHAHPRTLAACGIYSFIASQLLCSAEMSSVRLGLERGEEFYQGHGEYPHFAGLFSRDFASLPVEAIKSGGYVVDTLEAAVWCLMNTSSYRDCVLKAVNLGGDTDTIAAVAGGLAGILYGEAALPEEWTAQLADSSRIDRLCKEAAEVWG